MKERDPLYRIVTSMQVFLLFVLVSVFAVACKAGDFERASFYGGVFVLFLLYHTWETNISR